MEVVIIDTKKAHEEKIRETSKHFFVEISNCVELIIQIAVELTILIRLGNRIWKRFFKMLYCNIFSLIDITLGLNVDYIWITNRKKQFGKMREKNGRKKQKWWACLTQNQRRNSTVSLFNSKSTAKFHK